MKHNLKKVGTFDQKIIEVAIARICKTFEKFLWLTLLSIRNRPCSLYKGVACIIVLNVGRNIYSKSKNFAEIVFVLGTDMSGYVCSGIGMTCPEFLWLFYEIICHII